MTTYTIEDLRRENTAPKRVGDAIYSTVRDVIERTVPRGKYPERYFMGGDRDTDIDDIVQEMFEKELLPNGHLESLLTASHSADDFRGMVGRLVSRVLRRRMERTVVDNLLRRVRDMLGEPGSGFLTEGTGFDMIYWREGTEPVRQRPETTELRTAALPLLAVPKVNRGVYSRDSLDVILTSVAESTAMVVGIRDVEWILKFLLTPWLSLHLEGGEGGYQEHVAVPDIQAPDPEVKEAVTRIVAQLDHEHLRILVLTLAEVSKTEIASVVGVTRQTVHNRLPRIGSVLDQALDGLDRAQRDAAVELLGLALQTGGST